MSNYPNAGDGLKKIYVGLIGFLICSIVVLVPVQKLFPYVDRDFIILTQIATILAIIGLLVFFVVSLIGYYQAGKDIAGCRIAFILQIINTIISLTAELINMLGEASAVLDLINMILGIVIIGLLLLSVVKVMREKGEEEIAQQGMTAWWVVLGCEVVGFALLIGGFGLTALNFALFVSGVISIVPLLFELRFLKNSSERLIYYKWLEESKS